METIQGFIAKLEEALKASTNAVEVAENIVKVEVPSLTETTINLRVLGNFLTEFEFDWDNFDGGADDYDVDSFASDAVSKIEQILADIKTGNTYSEVFVVELAYSKLKDGDYDYKIVKQDMKATAFDEAMAEKDEIRSKAPKAYSDDEGYSLEDVRVLVKVVDQNEVVVIDEKFVTD